MSDLLQTHKDLWEKKKGDKAFKEKMQQATDLVVEKEDERSDHFAQEVECPACQNHAILFCELDGEYMDGVAVTTGAYVVGLECRFCGLELRGGDKIDHFRLNRFFYGDPNEEPGD